jgi:(p)ppGpp synthase/HD superfamily hydrolase
VGYEPGTPEFARGLPKTTAAVEYAEQMHDGQSRKVDGEPFILHPLEVAALLYDMGARDHVIAAGVLHDTLEKTDATAAELARRFGPRVASLVVAVTEDERITAYTRRKAALRDQVAVASRDALTVFAADKLSKVRELRLAIPGSVRPRRLSHYRHCLELLQEKIPNSPLVGALQTELSSLVEATRRQRSLSHAG